jgi:hypothetical protein
MRRRYQSDDDPRDRAHARADGQKHEGAGNLARWEPQVPWWHSRRAPQPAKETWDETQQRQAIPGLQARREGHREREEAHPLRDPRARGERPGQSQSGRGSTKKRVMKAATTGNVLGDRGILDLD